MHVLKTDIRLLTEQIIGLPYSIFPSILYYIVGAEKKLAMWGSRSDVDDNDECSIFTTHQSMCYCLPHIRRSLAAILI